MDQRLTSKILSILFVASKPVTVAELAAALNEPTETIKDAAASIASNNANNGIILLMHDDRFMLSSNPENSTDVKKFLSLELREKLTDASLETLAIIVYKQAVSKAEIENIRGVNSQYTLRQLLIRGLIEKTASTTDKRMQLYRPTLELLQSLGISSFTELPDFETLTKNIELAPPTTDQRIDL